MSAAPPPTETVGNVSDSWQQLRGDESIQFAPVELPQRNAEPNWLERFFNWLGEIFAETLGRLLIYSWPVLKWVLLAALIGGVLYLLYQIIDPFGRIKKTHTEAEEAPEWAPDHQAARVLLEDADRLAAEGKFDEATHLLLQRSVTHMSDARPDWVEPSSTARELANLEGLPDTARSAFTTIAERVERSLFALTPLERSDWDAARAAYANFALSKFDRGTA